MAHLDHGACTDLPLLPSGLDCRGPSELQTAVYVSTLAQQRRQGVAACLCRQPSLMVADIRRQALIQQLHRQCRREPAEQTVCGTAALAAAWCLTSSDLSPLMPQRGPDITHLRV